MKNYRIFYHCYSHKIFFYLFIFAFFLQLGFWYKTENIKPDFEIIPPAPSKNLVKILSFGDDEFLFRILGSRLQNSGDVFAGFRPLKEYDYSRVYQWMKVLDLLNEKSNFIPALASYYYSETQKKEDIHYVVDYLYEHSSKNVDEKWWWLFQATYIARDIMKDQKRALEVAQKLSENEAKEAPFWTKQLPAFIYEDMGNGCMAFKTIEKLMQENENGTRKISAEEMDFMRHFIKDRLGKLKQQKFDPRAC